MFSVLQSLILLELFTGSCCGSALHYTLECLCVHRNRWQNASPSEMTCPRRASPANVSEKDALAILKAVNTVAEDEEGVPLSPFHLSFSLDQLNCQKTALHKAEQQFMSTFGPYFRYKRAPVTSYLMGTRRGSRWGQDFVRYLYIYIYL